MNPLTLLHVIRDFVCLLVCLFSLLFALRDGQVFHIYMRKTDDITAATANVTLCTLVYTVT